MDEPIIEAWQKVLDELVNRTAERTVELLESKSLTASQNLPDPEENYGSRSEVASALLISLPTLNKRTRDGILKSYRIGGRVLYKWSEVFEALK